MNLWIKQYMYPINNGHKTTLISAGNCKIRYKTPTTIRR